MRYMFIILILFVLSIFSGCTGGIFIDDGVPRNDDGTKLVTQYNDLQTASHDETALFRGDSYLYSAHFSTSVGVPVYFLGCTQDIDVHFEQFNLELEGTPFDTHFYEAPTITVNGTEVTGHNLNRNYGYNTTLILYGNPTVNNTGTQIFHSTSYGKQNVAGSTIIPNEIILKRNECYLFEITNNDGATAEVTANFIWHDQE